MERQLWIVIVAMIKELDKSRRRSVDDFTDGEIVRTWFWAVINDRPVTWACKRCSWPVYERRWKPPSDTTMSRRLRSTSVKKLLKDVEERLLRWNQTKPMVSIIDGKPLPIGGCTKDRQAGYGRAAGCKAKGYKLHAIVGADGSIQAWRVAPMNKDERVMAKRLIPDARIQGYLLADANFDSNELYTLCASENLQLVAPPRYGFGCKRGHRKQSPNRLRSIEILSNPQSSFGRELQKQRSDIERHFGNLTNWGGSLTCLPAWARTHRRVHRWVQAKLILAAVRRSILKTTYVA